MDPPILTANSDVSKWVMGAIPLTPARIFFHVSATELPTGVIMPKPVTTTRRFSKNYTISCINEKAAHQVMRRGPGVFMSEHYSMLAVI